MRLNNLKSLRSSDIGGLRTIRSLFRLEPVTATLLVVLLLLAGLSEGIGIAALLPLLSAIGVGSGASAGNPILQAFELIGIQSDLGLLLVCIALLFILKSVLQFAAGLASGYAGASLATMLRVLLLERLLLARWSYFTSQPVGSIANSITTDSTRAIVVVTASFQIVSQAIQVAFYTAVAMTISWEATLAGAAAGFTLYLFLRRFLSMAMAAGRNQQSAFSHLLSRLVDQLGMVKPVKSMGATHRLAPFLYAEVERVNQTLRKLVVSKVALETLNEPILIVFLCIGIWTAVSVLQMEISLMIVLALVIYRGTTRVTALQSSYQSLVSSESFLVALMKQVEKLQSAAERVNGASLPPFERAIELRNVSFSYDRAQVLSHATLDIPAGKIVAIVGPSGSGKTSLIDLIVGLHEPDAGAILIDGVSLGEISLNAWRGQLGYVPQDTILLNDTILANVTLGDAAIDPQTVEDSLQKAGAWQFVSAMPEGIHTRAGERGMQLSGGQRQRIALARALARKPTVLILDEPTSALDAESANAFCETLKTLSGTLTAIVVSHQEDVVRAADVIFRVSQGSIRLERSPTLSNETGNRSVEPLALQQ